MTRSWLDAFTQATPCSPASHVRLFDRPFIRSYSLHPSNVDRSRRAPPWSLSSNVEVSVRPSLSWLRAAGPTHAARPNEPSHDEQRFSLIYSLRGDVLQRPFC